MNTSDYYRSVYRFVGPSPLVRRNNFSTRKHAPLQIYAEPSRPLRYPSAMAPPPPPTCFSKPRPSPSQNSQANRCLPDVSVSISPSPTCMHAFAHSTPLAFQGQERRNSLERRRSSSGSVGGEGGDGSPLTGPITRDEVFNLLEEKADRKDLEKRMAALVTRYTTARFGSLLSGGLAWVTSFKLQSALGISPFTVCRAPSMHACNTTHQVQRTSNHTCLPHDERPLASTCSRVAETITAQKVYSSTLQTKPNAKPLTFPLRQQHGPLAPGLIPACPRKPKSKQRGHPKGKWGRVGCTRGGSDRTGGAEWLRGNAGKTGGGERGSERRSEQQQY